MSLKELEVKAELARSLRIHLVLVMWVVAVIAVIFIPRKAHSQATTITTKSGVVVSVTVRDTATKPCACDTVKKVVSKPVAKPASKLVVAKSQPAVALQSRQSPANDFLSAIKFRMDSIRAEVALKALRDSVGVAEDRRDSTKAADAFKGQPIPVPLSFPTPLVPSTLRVEHSGKIAVDLNATVNLKERRSWKKQFVVAGILGAAAAYCVHENCFGRKTTVNVPATGQHQSGPVWAPNGPRTP